MQWSIGRPSEKQAAFFRARSRFIAYGGARGGGKSWAVRKKAAGLALCYGGIKILLLRRSFPELRENHILPMRQDLMGIAQYRETDKSFRFPNGSRILFGYCDGEADVLQYQGQEYDIIFLDEATQFTEFQFTTLTACLRGANSYPKRFYLTCNPGGVGHSWVKRLFIDREYRQTERPEDYTFIKALVYDNAALMERDTGYIRMLENLPESQRRAWLDGDWDIFEGQYFREFDREVHVVDPFVIPAYWKRYRALDYGLDMLACYWIAVDTYGRAVVYKELYEPNLIISEAAKRIAAMTDEPIALTFAPPDLWNRRQDTGKSVFDVFAEHGMVLTKAQNNRVMGWLAVKEWLKPFPDEQGRMTAGLRMFRSCRHLIKSLPALQYDPKNPSDCATEPHEYTHGPDAIRYFIAGRPSPSVLPRDPEEDDESAGLECFLAYGR
jgi:phage terminase large subunit